MPKKQRKSDIVEISILDVNDQENSSVINILVDFPEIVKNKYKYLEYSKTYHICYKEPHIVICLDNSTDVVVSEINLPDMAKFYSEKAEDEKHFEILFKKMIEVLVHQSIYSLVTDVILLEGFKGFNLKSETGGTVNDDVELFAYYLCKKIGIAQGYLPEL